MNVREKNEINKKTSFANETTQLTAITDLKSFDSSKKRKQLKLIENKQVRAVPDGYYTGLINDMHKDYINFKDKGTFLQMEQIRQASQLNDHSNEEIRFEERKLGKVKTPISLNASSIQCTLPSDYDQLENLSPLSFLTKYTKASINRQQIIFKLIRKIQRDTVIDIEDAKDIVFEYFNHYKTFDDINELFTFLDINSLNTLQSNEVVLICCYAERYFLHKLTKNENMLFQRPLQEIIDFEFLKRKLDRLKLTDSLQRFIKTLETSTIDESILKL
ncbi:unnamed protein product [Adineta steineri]|uniref:Uncharacterized protein n=1 Tax=Adineta steineri TaxID=433720 RepID=A0A815ACV7_9BILA|nr:unnamed protein product [Adineta steineri]CAF1200738.1 unnamed protein product [Adineta steineri]CAF1255648.1 unnamed protein product [Adineta steineri]